ncbi:MAG: protein kinase [Acidimicrobiales bacterium]|nr:protein kinase [Acidimicrobiales bacterium]
MPPPPTIDGYVDLVEIGEGGFAVVYRATQQRVGRPVALKVLKAADLDERAQRRFDRECQAMGSLSWHPSVVPIFDSGITDDGRPWLSMAYYERGSLADRVRRGGPLPWDEAVDVGVQVAGALGAAHAAGMLHRDLKPENLLVGPLGEARLGDFGIAALGDAALTTTGHSSFTVGHAAPEVLRGSRADERTDVYALASTIHTLVDGQPPFRGEPGEPAAAVLVRALEAAPRRLEGVPEALADLLVAAMAKEPTDRPGGAVALGEALQEVQRSNGRTVTDLVTGATPGADDDPPGPVADREPTLVAAAPASPPPTAGDPEPTVSGRTLDRPAPPPAPATAAGAGAGGEPATTPSPDGPSPSRRGRRVLVIGAVLVVAVAAVALLATRGGDDSAAPAPTTSPSTTALDADFPEAATVVAEVPVGDLASAVSVVGDDVWVSVADDTVSRVDPATDEVAATFDAGEFPGPLVESGGSLWVNGLELRQIDPEDGQVTVRSGSQTGAGIAATDVRQGARVPVTGNPEVWSVTSASAVFRHDAVTGAGLDAIVVQGGASLEAIAVGADSAWVTNTRDESLLRIPLDATEAAATIDLIGDVEGELAVSATDDAVWVALADGTVARVDVATNEVVALVYVGGGVDSPAIAATDDAVWVTASDDRLVRIDPASDAVVGTVGFDRGLEAVAATPTDVWVTSSDVVVHLEPAAL